MKFDSITICLDMCGCPNRCRHCWLGHAPNGNMPVEALTLAAEQFRPFTDSLTVDDWYREPDYHDDYRARWALCQALSDSHPPHWELVSVWRLVRDPSYAEWLAELGLRTAQLTLFGGREKTDFYTGRRHAYDEISDAIEILLRHGIAPRIQVFVNRDNIHELPLIEALIRELDLERRCRDIGQEFVCFLHQGSCDGENEKLYGVRVTPEELKRIPPGLAASTCRHFHTAHIEDVFGRTEQALFAELQGDRSTASYVSADPVFFIDGKFDVYPNITAPEPHWRLGNLKTDGAQAVLENYAESRSLAQHIRATVPLGDIVAEQGDPNSLRLFNRGDYIEYVLNRYCRSRT